MNFEEHINKETETIKLFELSTSDKIKVRKIFNEGYSSYDFIFTLKDKYIYFTEVKTRSVKDNDYPDTILEQYKVDRIYEEIDKANKIKVDENMEIRAGFLVRFKNGMYFFDLTRTPTTTSIKKCPKHTASNGNNNYVDKKLVHFEIKYAKKII
tara:strand:- start:276 stop:737 length:462 start_codon:yes stop_codon:yes gene_type:complete